MKYFEDFNLFEKNLTQSKAELKFFQGEVEINSNLSKLLDSIDAAELSVNTIFPFLEGNELIDSLDDNEEFQKELAERQLKISELFDTDDASTLIKIRLKYFWIYPEDSGELDVPLYIMLQYYSHKNEKWSSLKLYYVQKEIDNFYNELSSVTMEITKKGDKTKVWKYLTSNSGENWILQNTDIATSSFRKELTMADVEKLANHNQVEIKFS